MRLGDEEKGEMIRLNQLETYRATYEALLAYPPKSLERGSVLPIQDDEGKLCMCALGVAGIWRLNANKFPNPLTAKTCDAIIQAEDLNFRGPGDVIYSLFDGNAAYFITRHNDHELPDGVYTPEERYIMMLPWLVERIKQFS